MGTLLYLYEVDSCSVQCVILFFCNTDNAFFTYSNLIVFRPRLGPTASKVAVVGVIYFIMSSVEGFMRASVVSQFTLALRQRTSTLVLLVIEVRVFSGLAVC